MISVWATMAWFTLFRQCLFRKPGLVKGSSGYGNHHFFYKASKPQQNAILSKIACSLPSRLTCILIHSYISFIWIMFQLVHPYPFLNPNSRYLVNSCTTSLGYEGRKEGTLHSAIVQRSWNRTRIHRHLLFELSIWKGLELLYFGTFQIQSEKNNMPMSLIYTSVMNRYNTWNRINITQKVQMLDILSSETKDVTVWDDDTQNCQRILGW